MSYQRSALLLLASLTLASTFGQSKAQVFYHYDSRYDGSQLGLTVPRGGFFYIYGQTHGDERIVDDMVVIEALGTESDVGALPYVRTSQPSPFPPSSSSSSSLSSSPSSSSSTTPATGSPPKNEVKGEAEDVLADGGVLVGGASDQGVATPPSELVPTGIFQVPLSEGQSLAQALPSVVAVSQGPFGGAQATPTATAIVGPGGVAIAFPRAEAMAEAGVAISRPIGSSTAGPGGVAIAGGHAVATAGLGPLDLDQDNMKDVTTRSRTIVASPRINNVFINLMRSYEKPEEEPTVNKPASINRRAMYSARPLWKSRSSSSPIAYSSKIDLEKVVEAPHYSALSLQQLIESNSY